MEMIINQRPVHAEYVLYDDRLKTFSSWQGCISPVDMANAGFFHIGIQDVVKCYFCGKALHNWLPHDIPLNEHKLYFPKCGFLQLLTHVQKINILDTCEPINYPKNYKYMNHEIVKTILQMNIYDINYIKHVLFNRLSHSNMYNNIASFLKDLMKFEHETNSIEIIQLRQERKALIDEQLCRVCLNDKRCILFMPCRHLLTCKKCSKKLKACPVCREQIYATIFVFSA